MSDSSSCFVRFYQWEITNEFWIVEIPMNLHRKISLLFSRKTFGQNFDVNHWWNLFDKEIRFDSILLIEILCKESIDRCRIDLVDIVAHSLNLFQVENIKMSTWLVFQIKNNPSSFSLFSVEFIFRSRWQQHRIRIYLKNNYFFILFKNVYKPIMINEQREKFVVIFRWFAFYHCFVSVCVFLKAIYQEIPDEKKGFLLMSTLCNTAINGPVRKTLSIDVFLLMLFRNSSFLDSIVCCGDASTFISKSIRKFLA